MVRRGISYIVVSALILTVLINSVELSGASPMRAVQASSNSYLLWLKPPDVSGLNTSEDDYLTTFFLSARAEQDYLIPSLLDLQQSGYIDSFELNSPPCSVTVTSSKDVSLALTSLPNVVKVTEMSEDQINAAIMSFVNSNATVAPSSVGVAALGEISIHITDRYISGYADPLSTVTIHVTNTGRNDTFTATTGSGGVYTIGYDFRLGDTVNVSSGSTNRTITIPAAFSITANLATDIVSGAGPIGATINTELWRQPFPNANPVFDFGIPAPVGGTGTYSANYSSRNITRSDFVLAKYLPNSTDNIVIGYHPDFLLINESQNYGYGYMAPNSLASLRLLNSSSGVKAAGSTTTTSGGLFWVQFPADIAPGDTVEATTAGVIISIRVPSISVSIASPTTIQGSVSPASAGSPIRVQLFKQDGTSISYKDVSLGSDGQFSATFTASDLSAMYNGVVYFSNTEGHQVFTYFTSNPAVPTPTPPIMVVIPRSYLPVISKARAGGW